MKEINWTGSTKQDLIDLGDDACDRIGYQLDKVQNGMEPSDWKPMPTVGRSVKEIRVRTGGNAYRTIYIATLADAVHVLHVFQKTTQQTEQKDIDLAKRRLARILRNR